jgi:tetratricopeptide (TPR) repeat protein
LIGLVCALVATNQPAAVRTAAAPTPRPTAKESASADPVEKEYLKLLEDDDAAQTEVDKWIQDAEAFAAKGSSFSKATLNGRIERRFADVRKAYDEFLRRHPKHARARLAYGSFLNDIQAEEEAVTQWEKAKDLDPKNPAAWNNLANHYGHRGPIEKAFAYYEKALEINPNETVYLQNLATTTYLFRKDAMEFYKITEPQVFDRALDLYRRALKLDPKNFPLATDLAQSYYGIKPLRTEDALSAWDYALKVANDDIEREGVYTHIARVELNSGRFAEARRHLNQVTNQMYLTLKTRLLKNLSEKETANQGTNAPPAGPSSLK